MTELRENARCIFWSGALAFHGPKIIFLHDKHEEFLVEKSSFILCTFVYPRCYGRLKYGKIQRTDKNTKYSVLYAGGYKRKKV